MSMTRKQAKAEIEPLKAEIKAIEADLKVVKSKSSIFALEQLHENKTALLEMHTSHANGVSSRRRKQ